MQIKDKIMLDMKGLCEHGPINIVIFGDSVSHGVVNGYIDYENVYWNRLKKKLNQFRDYIPVNMINASVGGTTAKKSLGRIDQQVLKHEPDAVIVCFGLNDVNGTLSDYVDSLRTIFKKCKAIGADVIFMTPNMLNTRVADDTPEEYIEYAKKTAQMQNSGRMDEFIAAAVLTAKQEDVRVCDCYAKWKKIAKSEDVTMLLANRINHPVPKMHQLFADALYELIMGHCQNTSEDRVTMFQASYTKQDILSQLAQMKIPQNKIVLMHSSLRSVGTVEGGAQALLDAMIEYFTADGGLFCVPTHTWGNLGKEITLDMNDPITCLGAFSNIAAADARGIRSQNPTHSMVVFGDRTRALDFIKDEPYIRSGTAPESCYGKLYREGGYVLLVGVSHNRNTYLHCVEEMLGVTNRLSPEPRDVTVKLASGEIIRRKTHTHKTDITSDISTRYPKYETAFRYCGAITDGFIGNAPTQCCDARIMKETMERILKNSEGVDPLADERAIPQKWYC